ncbi:flagellar motor switch protein FliG [Thioalkalivibrio sp. XN279]|uniref:flagellar motor switch protein FliG n=1 Tax=Thioalkalivibrio sp. XN279 TaxID=2714953 RepID=UPI00140B6F38|nr:flagellar motor switch protein FliG [Thioalkalivibrio sp. XN279]NHA13367.1 flagellar motor switch protein FliG [Thioalkalivibrio sp. XN279]
MATSDSLPMTGTDRAAVLLMSLGEDYAAGVLKHMGPKEVQRVGAAMAALNSISRQDMNRVLDDFVQTVQEQTALGVGSDEYVRNVLISALGEDKAGSLIDRILTGRSSKGLEALKWMDPRAVAEMIRLEHPQIISIVLSFLDPDQAADVLAHLPDRLHPEIVMRIATLDSIQPSALQELDQILEKQFALNSSHKSSVMGGLKSAADIMNFLDSSTEMKVLEQIRGSDADLGGRIQELMFTFENLVDVDDRGVQALLRDLQGDKLILALKGASAPVREKIFRNMSKRAAEMMRDDLEAKGPVRLSDVEAAQKEILAVARKMAESGEIALGGRGGEQYV